VCGAVQMSAKWLADIEKKWGKGAIKSGSEIRPRGYRGTGSIALDVALGGGWAKRAMVQVMGKEGAGKTLLFDLAAIEAQHVEGLRSLIFDFEGTYDKARFKALGGDLDLLDVIDHESVNRPMLFAEDAFDVCKSLFRNDSPHACLCFDSTGAMVSIHQYEAKMEGGQEKQTMYSTARVMAEGLPIIGGTMFKSPSEPTVFFISQGRDNIGGMTIRGIPPRDKQTGGRALPFFATTRVSVQKADVFKGDVSDDVTGRDEKAVEVGHKTRVAVWKNKANRVQGRIAEFDVYNEGNFGVDRIDELAQLAIYTRVIKQSGSWYEIDPAVFGAPVVPSGEPPRDLDTQLGSARYQGLGKVKEALGDATMFADIDRATRNRLAEMMDSAPPAVDPLDEDDAQTDT
jgi:recombination protein RecA